MKEGTIEGRTKSSSIAAMGRVVIFLTDLGLVALLNLKASRRKQIY